jgi:Domain of unknown function (DUF5060)
MIKRKLIAALLGCLALGLFAFSAGTQKQGGKISGELKKWHRITLLFEGPNTSEDATPNSFSDYRLDVTFTKGARKFVVPGFYAADGKAGETSATMGNQWRVTDGRHESHALRDDQMVGSFKLERPSVVCLSG